MQSFNHKPLNESILNIRKSDVPACSDVWELHVWLTKLTSHIRYSLETFHGSSASRRPLMCTWRFFLRRWLELLASVQAAPVHFYTEDLIQHGLPSVLWLDLHYVSDASRWLNLHCYAVCVHWGKKNWPHGETLGFYWWSKKKKYLTLPFAHTHSLSLWSGLLEIFRLCAGDYMGPDGPPACPCYFVPAICKGPCGIWLMECCA